RLSIWRVGGRWYLFVLSWPALLSLAKTGLSVLLGGAPPDFAHPPFLQLYPLPPALLATTAPWVFCPLSSSSKPCWGVRWAKSWGGAAMLYPVCKREQAPCTPASPWAFCGASGTFPYG